MKPINFTHPILFGVTGPTGSGKTEISNFLYAHGATVVDADVIARKAFDLYPECVETLADVFGADIRLTDGTVDRKLLASRAFRSDKATARLNKITHPFILRLMENRLRDAMKNGRNFLVLDAPLLFEAELDKMCSKTIAVIAPRETRLAHILARDGISEAAANARMERQPNDEFYVSRADRVIYNDKDIDALHSAAEELLEWLTKEYAPFLTEETVCL